MIQIKTNKDCCGCSACVQVCPKQCITMIEDTEGFLYPYINKDECIDCNLCEKVCPVINQSNERTPLKVYAAKNKNEEIRIQSSSGGIFTLLAEQILLKNGVVFGARFDNHWEVVHDFTENITGLAAFRGSKYVQSRIGETYKQAEQFLKQNRKVLFTGTPCQIAGLKLYLRKEYENLITVDFICHGVPSPMVWRKYLKELVEYERIRNQAELTNGVAGDFRQSIQSIEFRNKKYGWKKFSFVLSVFTGNDSVNKTILLSQTLHKNIFLKGFLNNLYLRPSCHCCPVRSLKSGSDVTIADFWSIKRFHTEIDDDDKGVSLILTSTTTGENLISSIQYGIKCCLSVYDIACAVNPSIRKDPLAHSKRSFFFQKLLVLNSQCVLIENILKKSLSERTILLVNKIYNKLFITLIKR